MLSPISSTDFVYNNFQQAIYLIFFFHEMIVLVGLTLLFKFYNSKRKKMLSIKFRRIFRTQNIQEKHHTFLDRQDSGCWEWFWNVSLSSQALIIIIDHLFMRLDFSQNDTFFWNKMMRLCVNRVYRRSALDLIVSFFSAPQQNKMTCLKFLWTDEFEWW